MSIERPVESDKFTLNIVDGDLTNPMHADRGRKREFDIMGFATIRLLHTSSTLVIVSIRELETEASKKDVTLRIKIGLIYQFGNSNNYISASFKKDHTDKYPSVKFQIEAPIGIRIRNPNGKVIEKRSRT